MKKIWIPLVIALVFLLLGVGTGIGLYADTLFGPEVLPPVTARESTAQPVDYGNTYTPLVTSGTCYADTGKVYSLLKEGQALVKSGSLSVADFGQTLDSAITELGTFAHYYAYQDSVCIELNGTKYGAYTLEGQDPIGGGMGYSQIYTTGDYVVSTAEELYQAMRFAEPGEVIFVTGGTVIDLTGHLYNRRIAFNVRPGVILASNRGYVNPDGSVETGAIIRNDSTVATVLNMMEGSRLTGIVLQGPNPEKHLEHHTRAFRTGRGDASEYYYSNVYVTTCGVRVGGNGVQIDNCELTGFGKAAVNLGRDTKETWVHHCYIHHNQTNGLGYGVVHDNGAESTVEYCLFNYNRHSIAATGAGKTGYIARFNIEMGESLSHCFDIHGGADRGEASNHAGDYCEMYNNTFLADDHPYWLRGVPSEYQYFYHNACLYTYDTYREDKLKAENVSIYDNIFGMDDLILVR